MKDLICWKSETPEILMEQSVRFGKKDDTFLRIVWHTRIFRFSFELKAQRKFGKSFGGVYTDMIDTDITVMNLAMRLISAAVSVQMITGL